MVLFEALYGRTCISLIGWYEVGKSSLFGSELVYDVLKKVQFIRELEFEEGDKVYVNILPMKGVMQFGKKGKLSPRSVGPYEILQRLARWHTS